MKFKGTVKREVITSIVENLYMDGGGQLSFKDKRKRGNKIDVYVYENGNATVNTLTKRIVFKGTYTGARLVNYLLKNVDFPCQENSLENTLSN